MDGKDWFRGRGDTEEKIPLELLGGGANFFEFANTEINPVYSFKIQAECFQTAVLSKEEDNYQKNCYRKPI